MVLDLSPREIDEVEAAIPGIESPTVAGVLRRLVAAGRDEGSSGRESLTRRGMLLAGVT